MQAEQLRLNALLLVSRAGEYTVNLRPDVILISGPMFTGKSSILQLIDYCLGARRSPSYPEIRKCTHVYLELEAGPDKLTIERQLGSTRKANVFYGGLATARASDAGWEEVLARHEPDAKSVSSVVMSALGYAALKVKAAPSRDASKLSTFSLRDLCSFVYIDQDRMGSTHAFFEGHPFKAIKWRQAFEIFHGFHSDALTAAAESLREAEEEERKIRAFLSSAARFLDQAGVAGTSELAARRKELEGNRDTALKKLEEVRSAYGKKTFELSDLNTKVEEDQDEIRNFGARIRSLQTGIRKLEHLLVQYHRDEEQLAFVEESERLISALPVSQCPACEQPLETVLPQDDHCHVCNQVLPERQDELSYKRALSVVRARIRDLKKYIASENARSGDLKKRKERLQEETSRRRAVLERFEKQRLLPLTRAMVEANEEVSQFVRSIEEIDSRIRMRRAAEGEGSRLLEVKARTDQLRRRVEELRESRVEPDEVLQRLEGLYGALLEECNFPRLSGVAIDRQSYLPVVRSEPYGALSSRGAISLAVSLFMLALLEYGAMGGSSYPGILILDSPLMAIGRDSEDPEFKDQKIIDGFYTVLRSLSKTLDGNAQLILVDNRPPSHSRDLMQVAFTRNPDEGRYGLIDDETGAKTADDGQEPFPQQDGPEGSP